jgi:hypothetical protein
MDNFGTYLLRTGAISSDQLDEATQSQVIFGGRLGTNLAELGYLDLPDLRKHLSEHLAIPLPNAEWIKNPSPAAREAISDELVARFRVLPLRLDKRKLHLAMVDPRDPVQLDEIAFATGLILIPYILPEVQLFALIEHYYGVQREVRYIDLGREAARGKCGGPKSKPEAIDIGDDDLAPDSAAAKLATVSAAEQASEDLISEELFDQIHQRSEPATSESAEELEEIHTLEESALTLEDVDHSATPVERADTKEDRIASLEADLACAVDRDAVGDLALRIARRHADAATLFVTRGEVVSGFRGDGDRIPEDISGILLTAGFGSSLTAPVSSRVAFRGSAPDEGVDAKILKSLGRGDAREVAVFPILIRGQVVNLLYTDSGPDVCGETSFAALAALANLVSAAYERLILARKSALA